MSERVPLLVLGLGNVLLADDGVGAAVVARLTERYTWDDDVQVLDGGTLGLSLLPLVEEAEILIIVDAVRTDEPAGTLVRLDGDEVAPAVAHRLSPHQVGVADVLDGARLRGRYPNRVLLLGVVPASLDLGVGLSPEVAPALQSLVDLVAEEAAALGFVFRAREIVESACDVGTEGPAARRVLDVARLVGLPA